MVTKQEIEDFYRHVEILGLRFPVADIERATGESKGNVSRILKRRLTPSESFLKKFYNSFNSRLQLRGSINTEEAKTVQVANEGQQEIEYLKLLLAAKNEIIEEKEARRQDTETRLSKADAITDRLLTVLERRLVNIQNDQRIALAYQKAWVELHAEEVAKGNVKEKKAVMATMNKLIAAKLEVDVEDGNLSVPNI